VAQEVSDLPWFLIYPRKAALLSVAGQTEFIRSYHSYWLRIIKERKEENGSGQRFHMDDKASKRAVS
jgi:hypothetical protein